MGKGYIKLHREIIDHWIFQDAEKFRAWVWLLEKAKWQDHKEVYKGRLMNREVGKVYGSIGYYAESWKWSENRVRRFFKALESDGMIRVDGTPDGTTVTIENWGKWQGGGTPDGRPGERPGERPDERPDGRHIKKEKELNNNFNKPKELSAYFDEGFEKQFVDSGMTEPITGEPVLIPTAETVEQRLKAMRRQRDEVLERWKLKGN